MTYFITSLFFLIPLIFFAKLENDSVEFEGCFYGLIELIILIGWIIYTIKYFL